MKKTMCLIIAAAVMLTCGCAGTKGNDTVKPSPTPKTVTANTEQPAAKPTNEGNLGYVNSAVFEDGNLISSDFDWEFFSAKVNVGMAADISIISRGADGDVIRTLEHANGVFTITDNEGKKLSYNYLITDTVAAAGGGETSVAFLTDDPDMTAETLFSAGVPEKLMPGEIETKGYLVFVKSKTE